MFYIDDSGAPATRTSVFGWVELDVDAWYPTLQRWLDWRRDLHRTIGIPAYYEFHGTKFVAGRGRPTGTPWDTRKAERTAVVTSAFTQMSSIPDLSFGAVYACATTTKDHRQLKARCYLELVRLLDDRLARDGESGIVVMDGDGTDLTYQAAHRELRHPSRRLMEDPFFRPGHTSQWVQMADLVAYAAYMHLARLPTKEVTWSWYSDYLSKAVTGAVPLRLTAAEKS